MWSERRVNTSEQAIIIELGISSGSTHLVERERLIAV
jgi:hypothetical protein